MENVLGNLSQPDETREDARLAALGRYDLMDTPAEDDFDDLTRLAAQVCETPIAIITLLDDTRQWFKSCVGLDITQTPRDLSFCRYALDSRDILLVPDTTVDPRFSQNPFVTGEPFVRFYAGAPLVTSDGYVLGTLCVVAHEPRTLSTVQQQTLKVLSRQVVVQMELRRRLAELEQADAARWQSEDERHQVEEDYRSIVENAVEGMFQTLPGRGFLMANPALARMLGYRSPEQVLEEVTDVALQVYAEPTQREELQALFEGADKVAAHELQLRRRDGEAIWVSLSARAVRDAETGQVCYLEGSAVDITDKRLVQDSLRQLAAVVEASHEAITSITPKGIIVSWNRGAQRIYGFSAAEAIGRMFTELVPSGETVTPVSLVHRVLAGEHISDWETARIRRDGTRVEVSVSMAPIQDREGGIQAISVIARDITARKQAQNALQAAEQQLRAVIDSAPLILFALDRDGIITLSEGKELKAIGMHPGQTVGMSVWDIYAARPEILISIRSALEGQHQVTLQDVGGVTLETYLTPMLEESGAVVGLLGVSLNVTERRAAERALQESEARFRGAFDDAPIGLCLTGQGGRYLLVNRALCEIVGYSEAELLGMTFSQITYPEDLDADLHLHGQLLAGHRQNYAMEKRYLHKNGHVVWVQLNVSLVRSAPGQPSYSIAQIQDITQRQALEEERERLLTQTEALLAEALERADRDPLTGLLNHRAFHKRLAEECMVARNTGRSVAVAMLDLDNFRFFNDTYGHLAGDDVLRQSAQSLRQNSRPEDTVARFGGDQFALLLPGVDAADASALVRCMTDALSQTGYRPEDAAVSIPLCFSSGIAVYPHDAETLLAVVERADERLRRAQTGADNEDPAADRIRARVSRSVEGFSMLDALVTAVDNKDRYTRRHSEDVLTYSLQIASELGLDEKMRHTIGTAALLHDVGKIGVPDRILRKPGKLDEAEFQAIQQHPMMGAIIVAAVPGLEETLGAIRHHHERWDGAGYPFGLRGEETPFLARLMAVADAFSAMTTDRPYRKGMSQEKALAILKEGAGTQWDARLVEVFLNARHGTGTSSVLEKAA